MKLNALHKNALLLIVALLLLVPWHKARAGCYMTSGEVQILNVLPGNIALNPSNYSVGSVMTSGSISGYGGMQVQCNGTAPYTLAGFFGPESGAINFAPGYPDVVKSNIAGIGYRVKVDVGQGFVTWTSSTGAASTRPLCAGNCTTVSPAMTVQVEIVKYAAVVGSGVMDRVVLAFYGSAGSPGRRYVYLGSGGNITIVAPTCSVSTGNVTIPLGTVNASSLGSVGATSPTSATQNVSLICQGNPSVRMTVAGSTVSGYNNVLALTTGANTAAGVGVQLMYNNNPLVYGGQVYVLSGGAPNALNVPIAARYYRTGNIAAGAANARATLNFTYN